MTSSRRLLAAAFALLPAAAGYPAAVLSPPEWDGAVTIVAAGDIADCRYVSPADSGAARTAQLIAPTDVVVLTLGDHTYPVGAPSEYSDCFEPTWGRFKDRLRPVPGNHDVRTPGARGYLDYFGALAGPGGRGYDSFELAGWHVIALNSTIDAREGSAQHRWLLDDLRQSGAARCTLAYWHHPVFSSGPHGNDSRMHAALAALHAAGAEIVLAAHDHVYERMVPHDAAGVPDPLRGIRSFTAGTGGAGLYQFESEHPLSAFRDASAHGVLRLTLGNGRYRWSFVTVDGIERDAGEGTCWPP